jgi:large subunit ribosomal protein L23
MSYLVSYDKIKSLVYTEKSNQSLVNNKYFFKVDDDCNRSEVASLVKKLFNVEVEKVNIINVKSKPKRFKGIKSQTKAYKKAVVTLKEGQSINFGS